MSVNRLLMTALRYLRIELVQNRGKIGDDQSVYSVIRIQITLSVKTQLMSHKIWR